MAASSDPSHGLVSPPLDLYAWPLAAPGDEPRVRFVELALTWRWDGPGGEDRVVVGRPPLRSIKPLSSALKNARGRALFSRKVKRGVGGLRLAGSQLLPPPGGSGASGVLRNWLLSGAVYRLAKDGRFSTVLDRVAHAAGAEKVVTRFHASGDGSVVAPVDTASGPAILRAARRADPSDPRHIAEGLEHLAAHGVAYVPRPLGKGEVEGISWMTESLVSGRVPSRVEGSLLEDVVGLCERLPRSAGPPSAPFDELGFVAGRLSDRAEKIEGLRARIEPVVNRLPAVTRHGDLWAGNLLERDGRLVGVIDWAAWHGSAAPGTDLLHLWAAESKKGGKRELGEAWRERPWNGSDWRDATSSYWDAVGIDLEPEVLEAVAVAWWATWVAQSLARYPARADNARWVRGNVDVVLESFE